jgi:hypothetical protein
MMFEVEVEVEFELEIETNSQQTTEQKRPTDNMSDSE